MEQILPPSLQKDPTSFTLAFLPPRYLTIHFCCLNHQHVVLFFLQKEGLGNEHRSLGPTVLLVFVFFVLLCLQLTDV